MKVEDMIDVKDGGKRLPTISLLVLSYNGKHITPIILDSILKLDYPKDKIETLIIDNASTDGSATLFASKYPWAKILTMERNVAYAAFNRAVQVCKGEYCFILNNDIEFDSKCLKEIVAEFERHPEAVAVGPALYDFITRKQLYTHKYLSRSFYNGSDYGTAFTQKDDEMATKETYTGVPALRTSFAKSLPYVFDPDYFLYVEDVDLAYRLRLMGHTIYRARKAIVYHKPGSTAKEVFSSERLTFLIERNTYQTYFKNLAWYNLILFSPYFFGLRLLNFGRHVLRGNFTCARAMIGAWWWNVTHLGLLISKRMVVQRLRKVTDRVIFAEMMNERKVIKYVFGRNRRR